jgi:hypothetical protein
MTMTPHAATPPQARGRLATTSIAELLAMALERRSSGSFVFETPSKDRSALVVASGRVTKVRTAEPVEPLGRLLTDGGVIDRATLERGLRIALERKDRLGEALVQLDVVDRQVIERTLREQLGRRLSWLADLPGQSAFGFYANVDFLEDRPECGADPLSLIWRCMRDGRLPPPRQATVLSALGTRRIGLAERNALHRFELSPGVRSSIESLHVRPLSLDALITHTGLSDALARRLIYALLITRQLEPLPVQSKPPPSARPSVPPDAATAAAQSQSSRSTAGASSALPASQVSPASGSQMPPARASQMPPTRASQMPPASGSQMPPARASQMPPARASQMPPTAASASSALPASQVSPASGSQMPPARASQMPPASASQMPSARASQMPPASASQMPPAATSQMPSARASQMPPARASQVPPASQPPTERPSQAPDRVEHALERASRLVRERARAEGAAEAARAIEAAQDHVTKKQYADAEPLVRAACNADPDNPEYLALHAWLRVQIGEHAVPAFAAQIVSALDRAVMKAPMSVPVRFYRAQVLKRLGRDEEAYKDFRFVARRAPDQLDAVREVRLHAIRTRNKQKQSGVFSRLFHR